MMKNIKIKTLFFMRVSPIRTHMKYAQSRCIKPKEEGEASLSRKSLCFLRDAANFAANPTYKKMRDTTPLRLVFFSIPIAKRLQSHSSIASRSFEFFDS